MWSRKVSARGEEEGGERSSFDAAGEGEPEFDDSALSTTANPYCLTCASTCGVKRVASRAAMFAPRLLSSAPEEKARRENTERSCSRLK